MAANLALTSLAGLGVYLLVKWKTKNDSSSDSESCDINKDLSNEVLFFPDKNHPCPLILSNMLNSDDWCTMCTNRSCGKLHGRPSEPKSSFLKFLGYLAKATRKVDLCVYILTQPNLANLLLGLHSRGVKIRIITDSAESEAAATKMEKLQASGIEVKSNRKGTGALMHHKFLIIDDHWLLSGSFNWTTKAVVSNYEAVTVTSDQAFVEPFRKEFDTLWAQFEQHK